MTDRPLGFEALDVQILLEYEQMSPGLAAELGAMFLDDVPRRLAAMRSALAEGDLRTLSQLAHTLKGTSSNLGAGDLATACADLQSGSEGGSPAKAAVLLEAVDQAWQQVEAVLPGAVEAAGGAG